ELLKFTPRQGALVKTPDGQGVVEYVEILKGRVKVRIENKSEAALSEYDVKDIEILKRSKGDSGAEKIDEEILKTLEE
ncbi:MAG: stage 0 sporulation protein, partial [Clostridia bacterium]|nr:stage 0 sporulation protein [Clostridia bacterium]